MLPQQNVQAPIYGKIKFSSAFQRVGSCVAVLLFFDIAFGLHGVRGGRCTQGCGVGGGRGLIASSCTSLD